jgi:hypothetical protein
MKVIIAWDGDHIGREVGRASLADDVEGLRRISQAIDTGNRIWESWVTMNGGSIISFGGDEGRAEILAEKLAELPKIRDQYATAVGSTVSVGVGTKLSEADRALMCGKLQGGDKIVLYTPDVDQTIEKLQGKGQKTEADKLAEEYLNKAQPAANTGAGAGFEGHSSPTHPKMDKPAGPGEEHSQGEAAQAQADGAPPPPEATASADQFEDQFHQAAQDQQSQDQGQPQAPGQDQVRSQLVQTLTALKQQMPILEQLKGTAPDTYQAIMSLAQTVVVIARQMNGDAPNQTGARELADRAASQAQIEVPMAPEEGGDDKKKDEGEETKKSEKETEPEDWHDCKDFGHCWGNGETGEHCLLCGTSAKEHEESLDKASLSPGIGKTPAEHHHLNLPVGTQKPTGPSATRDVGKVKVMHPDTSKQGWIEARAGQIMSQDGHAISARNPNGK